VQSLHEECGLADARFPGKEYEAAGHQASAKHAIELGAAAEDAREIAAHLMLDYFQSMVETLLKLLQLLDQQLRDY
jgi:hypothetical protein